MKLLQPTVLALALVAAFPAAAQGMPDVNAEIKALRTRLAELEKKVGMTPEQQAEFNRIAAKTEAMQDTFTDKGFAGLKISGYIEPVFVWNQRQNRAGFQFLNNPASGPAGAYSYDTSYMGAAVLDLTKETESGTIWKLTLAPNRSAGTVVDGGNIVQEASVSVPMSDSQTRLIAGQLPDWSGYEYQQPTLNPFTSHNLLFDFTLPTTYTGAGMDIKEGKWWIRTALANVNATIRANGEKAPAWAFRADYAKGEFSGWGFASLIGKAPRFYDDATTGETGLQTTSNVVMMELDGWYTRGDLTLGGQVSWGKQKEAAISLAADGSFQDAEWAGISGMVGYSLDPRLQLLARADYIRNDKHGGGLFTYNYADGYNGLGPDAAGDAQKGANRWAVTLGTKYLVNTSTTFKAEVRMDGASLAVFEDVKTGTFKKTNTQFATSLLVAF
ncbi:DUF3138 family protein [Ideonella livida]|uniref:DUF3138 family protein n=1 Tax=Ideonella livida TaxID=2707176 RepID=A0A7C9TJW3_9BURK|nr:DUF3138 family protein [Ideonella livida]NDY90507.1 DUF3138 family protein [Ideonella livida]